MAKQPASDPRPICPQLEVNRALVGLLTAVLLLWFNGQSDQTKPESREQPPPTELTIPVVADLKVNGADWPVVLRAGQPYTYRWDSRNAAECDISSPFASSVDAEGSGAVQPGDDFYYPTITSPVLISVICKSDHSASTDSVLIRLDTRRLLLATILSTVGWHL
jgi:hypothetical protein